MIFIKRNFFSGPVFFSHWSRSFCTRLSRQNARYDRHLSSIRACKEFLFNDYFSCWSVTLDSSILVLLTVTFSWTFSLMDLLTHEPSNSWTFSLMNLLTHEPSNSWTFSFMDLTHERSHSWTFSLMNLLIHGPSNPLTHEPSHSWPSNSWTF